MTLAIKKTVIFDIFVFFRELTMLGSGTKHNLVNKVIIKI